MASAAIICGHSNRVVAGVGGYSKADIRALREAGIVARKFGLPTLSEMLTRRIAES